MAMCAIANGGCLMRPMLVNRLEDRNGNVVAAICAAARPAGHQSSHGQIDG